MEGRDRRLRQPPAETKAANLATQAQNQIDQEVTAAVKSHLTWGESNHLRPLCVSAMGLVKEYGTVPQEEWDAKYAETQRALVLYEAHLKHQKLMLDRFFVESELLVKAREKVAGVVEELQESIVETKAELQEARKVRTQREQYDILAKEVNKKPTREECRATIEEVKAELKSLEQQNDDAQESIDFRNKQAQLVLHSVADLRASLSDSAPLPLPSATKPIA